MLFFVVTEQKNIYYLMALVAGFILLKKSPKKGGSESWLTVAHKKLLSQNTY